MDTPPKNQSLDRNPSYDAPEVREKPTSGKGKVVIGAMVAVALVVAALGFGGFLASNTADRGVEAEAPSVSD